MPLRTKRWNDPAEADDGFRVLICRGRPRGVPKAAEPWDAWWKDLGPSRELLDAFHGKRGRPVTWPVYAKRYLDEMRGAAQVFLIRGLRQRLATGEPITLLCSTACTDPERCHRTLLARILESSSSPTVARSRR